MNKITEIAVDGTTDPMQEVLECLFEKEHEIFISDEVLELMKSLHSFNMTPHGKNEVYTFNKRGRGTHIGFSFMVTPVETNVNKVSKLEYTTEIGVVGTYKELPTATPKKKVYIILKEEAA